MLYLGLCDQLVIEPGLKPEPDLRSALPGGQGNTGILSETGRSEVSVSEE